MHIDHTTFRTNYLAETRDFLLKVFNLAEGPRPARIAAGIKGHWLYYKNAPLIHLIQSAPFNQASIDRATEAIDQTGFFMEGHEIFKQKLTTLNIPYSLMDLPEIGERRGPGNFLPRIRTGKWANHFIVTWISDILSHVHRADGRPGYNLRTSGQDNLSYLNKKVD
jgi:glyoxylase I family protein